MLTLFHYPFSLRAGTVGLVPVKRDSLHHDEIVDGAAKAWLGYASHSASTGVAYVRNSLDWQRSVGFGFSRSANRMIDQKPILNI